MIDFLTEVLGEVEADSSRNMSERAKKYLCPKCKKPVWAGYCRTGFQTYLRPQPLTPAEDLAFYIAGRRTYKLWRTGDGFEFELRLASDLKKPTADIKLPVHDCSDRVIDAWPDYWPARYRPFIPLNQEPPF